MGDIIKKIIFIICILLIYFIYKFDNKLNYNYVSIGDNTISGINSYNMRIMGFNDYIRSYLDKNNLLNSFNNNFVNKSCYDIYNDIRMNRTIVNDNTYYLKKLLRESDILVISCGMESLYYNDFNLDKFINDFRLMISEVNKYAMYKVIVLGYYNKNNIYDSNSDSFYYILNSKCKSVCDEYDFIYLDLYELVKQNKCVDNNSYLLNSFCNLKIAELLLKYI